jgi:redox-sensitive bicupin YhaK (pirin superfamily)
MITLRRSGERGSADHGWLDARHSFSFADYFDREHMGFRQLRVLNEDRIRGGAGFPTHGHRDMEILTYLLAGELEHRDDMGNGSVIRPGEVQRMTAGRGVLHSERNPSDEVTHLLQIWLLPAERGLEPGYEQRAFPADERRGRLQLVASSDARDGSLHIHTDADVWAAVLAPGDEVAHELAPGRHAWLQIARGSLELNGELLEAGDGAAVSDETRLVLTGRDEAELLLFDLA